MEIREPPGKHFQRKREKKTIMCHTLTNLIKLRVNVIQGLVGKLEGKGIFGRLTSTGVGVILK
jgi:hypothetical protein